MPLGGQNTPTEHLSHTEEKRKLHNVYVNMNSYEKETYHMTFVTKVPLSLIQKIAQLFVWLLLLFENYKYTNSI